MNALSRAVGDDSVAKLQDALAHVENTIPAVTFLGSSTLRRDMLSSTHVGYVP